MSARLLLLIPPLLVGGCYDQPISNDYGSTTPRVARPAEYDTTLGEAVTPVRTGELGPNFAACNAQGVIRERAAEGAIPVRAAPFEQARETARLAAGSSFFICSRSLDQRWLGIIYEAPGRASRGCGVSTPVQSRRDYDGPCESGWVSSAQVRLVSGVQPPPAEASQNVGEVK